MPKKTLAELRAEPPRSRPERVLTICLAPHLVAEVQVLIEELENLPIAAARASADDGDGPPRRMSDGDDPRAADIRARLAELLDEMAAHEGQLRLRARPSDGDWRRWANEHPARPEDQSAEHQRDLEVAMGYCNADDLIEDLGKYASSWDDDPLADGDWENIFEPNVSGPDKKQIAQAVVSMYERVTDVPKWASALSATLRSWPAASAPATSRSPSPSSSGESQPSDTSTTTPTTS